ncbi:MAG TPA: hypothetical protein VGA85_06025 [Dehalococcoidales bacterium]
MGDTKRWVVTAEIEGPLYIRKRGNTSLPEILATTALTYYAMIEQKWPAEVLYLGLEIPTNTDPLCVAYQEMEAFLRALAIEKQAPITARNFLEMTDRPEKWPKGIGFLYARDFPQCSRGWQPVDHYKDPKNRVRSPFTSNYAASLEAGRTDSDAILEKLNQAFAGHSQYQQALVKDYLAGLDNEFKEPSLSMLYFYKVLERIGKKEHSGPKRGTLTTNTLEAIIHELNTDLTAHEKQNAKDINRWRHNKSEAHLVTEGLPTVDELALCKKIARLAVLRRV